MGASLADRLKTEVAAVSGLWRQWEDYEFLGGTDDSVPNGLVVMIREDGNEFEMYVGQVVNGIPEDLGISFGLIDGSTDFYYGGFKSGKYSGRGIRYREGIRYEGEFIDGLLQGMGTCTKGLVEYDARFEDDIAVDVFQSRVAASRRRVTMATTQSGGKVLGEFTGNVLNGTGAYLKADGTIYIGVFINDVYQLGSGIVGSFLSATPQPAE